MKPRLPVRTRGAPTKPIEQRKTKSGRKQGAPLTSAMELFVARFMVRHNMDSHPAAS